MKGEGGREGRREENRGREEKGDRGREGRREGKEKQTRKKCITEVLGAVYWKRSK